MHGIQGMLYWQFRIEYDDFIAQRKHIEGTSALEESSNFA